MMAKTDKNSVLPRCFKFESDSVDMLIDNGASRTIWNRKRDLKNYRTLTNKEVQIIGLSSTKIPEGISEIDLRLIDDEGKEHKFEVL